MVTLLPGHIRHPQCGDGLGVDSSVRLEALLALEADQCLRCRPAQYAVGLASIEAFFPQGDLHLANLIRTEIHAGAQSRSSARTAELGGTAG